MYFQEIDRVCAPVGTESALFSSHDVKIANVVKGLKTYLAGQARKYHWLRPGPICAEQACKYH